MPTFPFDEPVNGCVGVRIFAQWTLSGSIALLTPNIGFGGTPEDAEVSEAFDIVKTWINDVYADMTSASWLFTRLQTFSREDPVGPIRDEVLNIFGTATPTPGSTEQAQWAPLVLTGSGRQGYGEHGRLFNLAPIPSQVDYTGYQPVYMNGLITAWQALNTALLAGSFAMALGIARQSRGNVVPVRSWAYSPKLTMQKRRRYGFGE